jgi:hypothetical protein
MTRYEVIYDKGWEDRRYTDPSPAAPHQAGIAAVVAAAKVEALEEASKPREAIHTQWCGSCDDYVESPETHGERIHPKATQ